MGGQTGASVGIQIANIAKDMRITTIGLVTVPFAFEAKTRIVSARKSLNNIHNNMDSVVVLHNDNINELHKGDLNIHESFKKTDTTICHIIRCLIEITEIRSHLINRDINDLVSVIRYGGFTLVSYGVGTGDNCIEDAIQMALQSPLLHNHDIFQAGSILFNISLNEKTTRTSFSIINKTADNLFGRFNRHAKVMMGLKSYEFSQTNEDAQFIIIANQFKYPLYGSPVISSVKWIKNIITHRFSALFRQTSLRIFRG